MAINTLTKNSIGVVLALLLVILLSESRLFNLLTETYLGRAFLIVILLFASYLNKILGVVCVFIIIIMFNNNNNSFYEGNTTMKESDSSITSTSTAKTNTNSDQPINVTTSAVTAKNNDTKKTTTSNSSSTVTTPATSSPATKSIEGFDLQSTENTIKRGKQSNSIPVNQYNKQSIEVAPYEEPNFSNLFGLL
jgi:hypothetical protein